ncbi:MAG: hypothetical protein U0271_40025 [Polyangiaceae bacterium]
MRALRGRALAVLLAGALVFGALGASFDQITVSLSPEYFTLGKGLAPEGLRAAVAVMGFRAALPLGAALAGVGLLREARGRPWRGFVVRTLVVMSVAVALGALLMPRFDPFDVRRDSAGVLADVACDRYLRVWGMHAGAYVGVAVALALSLVTDRGTNRR